MANVDRAYVTIGPTLLVVSMLLGLYMGATSNNIYLEVHTEILLVGFAVLTSDHFPSAAGRAPMCCGSRLPLLRGRNFGRLLSCRR